MEELWAYYRLRGFGESRADLRAAIVAQAAAQPHCAASLPLEMFLPRDEFTRPSPAAVTAGELEEFRQWEAEIRRTLPDYKRPSR